MSFQLPPSCFLSLIFILYLCDFVLSPLNYLWSLFFFLCHALSHLYLQPVLLHVIFLGYSCRTLSLLNLFIFLPLYWSSLPLNSFCLIFLSCLVYFTCYYILDLYYFMFFSVLKLFYFLSFP